MNDFNDYYPKQRTGKECKKMDCDRYKDYVAWQCGTASLNFCMACKHAHVSQYKRKGSNAEITGAEGVRVEGTVIHGGSGESTRTD